MSTQAKLAAVGLGLAMAVQPAVAETVNKGDILNVQIERDSHMKVGETVRARTVYPLYVDNRLVVPAGSELVGTITSLEAVSKKARMHARLGGDFTPLHSPQIKFDHLVLPGGTDFPIETVTATGGTEVVRFQAMNATGHHPSIVKKLWADAIGREKETVRTFTAPGKKDRVRRMLYSELPYHPELLTEGTQFAVEMAAPVQVPASVNPPDNKSAEKGVDSTVTLAAELVTDI
ncbi:MAG: hypothetical protein ACXVZV_12050, partial [Terriglobales bacterium]